MRQSEIRAQLQRLATLREEAKVTASLWQRCKIHRETQIILRTLAEKAPRAYAVLVDQSRFAQTLVP